MKKQYSKEFEKEFLTSRWWSGTYRNKRFRKATAYRYQHISTKYFRKFQHVGWHREVDFVRYDDECRYYNIRPRVDDSRRTDPWDDYPVNRNYGRSWKDYTKYKKQWLGNSIKCHVAKEIDTSLNGKSI